MLDTLISSKTRVKLLLKFFLNSDTKAYIRGLESEFKESANAIRTELNNLEKAGMLKCETEGNRKYFRANTAHPLYEQLHQIVMKQVGINQLVENVTQRLGNLERVYLVGSFARGIDSPILDVVFIGNIDRIYLLQLIEKAEDLIGRRIRYIVYGQLSTFQAHASTFSPKPVLLWDQMDV